MNEKMRRSVMGLILGQFSSPLPISQKEPVAYLYNGVRLPALPEWDREKYPYAMICYTASLTAYWILVSEGRPYYTNTVTPSTKHTNGIGVFGYWCRYTIDAETNSFVLGGDYGKQSGLSTFLPADNIQVIWSNFDIIDDNGEVYMAVGETNYPDAPPVPGETVVADPCPDKSVMYLYDNAATDEAGDTVTFPAIPEIDRRVYPYLALSSRALYQMGVSSSVYRWALVASRYPLIKYSDWNDKYRHHQYCFINESGTEWEGWYVDESYWGPLDNCYVDAWANHDVYDSDGNLAIIASTPTPIYE